ncbi:MAG: UDP-N-acetylmuramoyl-L-alanyl-D-glutamate--2,6-diaminopimelate ligase [Chloroflexi bacterium]|nr:UDP-N-acetylmuramoyl-L-alanyl-D-glutamate--2,6-diaminopimelate ligase [Chloroflexota bacterium]
MTLKELIAEVPASGFEGDLSTPISGICDDSRQVRPGDAFVAIPGLRVDGHDFVDEAIERGASALVLQRSVPTAQHLPRLLVPDSKRALALLAAAFYGHPGRRMGVIGVTGTDGKTTTCRLIAAILVQAGYQVGSLTTVGLQIGNRCEPPKFHMTTPGPIYVQQCLAEMASAECRYAVLEVSSHGLAQDRVLGCEFDVSVLTNIAPEHLDYHGTYEEYCATKAKLFDLLDSWPKPGIPKVKVLNADDPAFSAFREPSAQVNWSYGLNGQGELQADDVSVTEQGIAFRCRGLCANFHVQSPLLGRFNVYNVLAAIAVGLALGVPVATIQQALATASPPPGRMERIDLGQKFTVLVDFAHTPQALAHALETTRELTGGRVIVVFGCAGQRDWRNRPEMGAVAGHLADCIVITADDPRTEDVAEISASIAEGCRAAERREGRDFWRIPDRTAAIRFAIETAQPGDLVLLAGKGHERTMLIGDSEQPWSDHEVAKEAIASLLTRKERSQ